ncbi:MAG: hypothetical protein QOJ45_793 [Verrucomicrobiota bacterium]
MPREFNNSNNSLNRTLSRLFGHLEKNVQPLLAGKLAIKLAIRFFGLGEIAKLDGFLRHGRIIAFLRTLPRESFN